MDWIRQRVPVQRVNAAHVALAVILGVALFFRLWYLNAIEHTIDHAYPVWESLETLDLGRWPLISQETPDLFVNPGLLRYLMLPVVAIFRSPVAVYFEAIALNTFAVWLVYKLARRLFGDGRALVAAGLMAVNPWLVEYSRDTWQPVFLPFFTALVAYLLFPVFSEENVENKERRTLWGWVAIAAMANTYLLGYFTAVTVGLLVLLFWRRWPLRAVVAGVAVLVAAGLIYLGALLARGVDPLGQVGSFTEDSSFTLEGLGHAVRLVTGNDYEMARGRQAPIDDVALRRGPSLVAHYVILAALVAGVGVTLVKVWRREEQWRGYLAALIWVATPIVMMAYVSRVVHPYYMLTGLPGGYLLAAAGAGLVWRWAWGRRALAIVGVLLVPLFALNIARYHQETRAIPGAHDLWALPLDIGLEMGRTLNDLTVEQPRPPRVFYEWEPQIIGSLSGRVIDSDGSPVRNLPELSTVLPEGASLYVLFDAGSGLATPFGATEVDERAIEMADGTAIRFYRYEREPDALLAAYEPEPVGWPSDFGLTLVGYSLDGALEPGEAAMLTTWWRMEGAGAPEGADWLFAPFVHVYDASGERVAIGDGVPVAMDDWPEGTLHIQRTRLEVPVESRGPFALEVGQWDALRNFNATFLPPGDEPTAVYRIE